MDTSLSEITEVITFAAGKGGVGKTSIAANVAGLMATAGYHVLLLTLDPQDNLGEDLGYTYAQEGQGSDDGYSLCQALMGQAPLQVVLPDVRPGLDVIPGGEHLWAAYNDAVRAGVDPFALTKALLPLADDYDFIFLDLPPNHPLAQTWAFTAARWVLVPTQTDESSIKGISKLARDYVQARTQNQDLELLGTILFDVASNATQMSAETRRDLDVALGGVMPVLAQAVRSAKAPARAARKRGLLVHELAHQRSVSWKAALEDRDAQIPTSAPKLAGDYQRLAREIITLISAAKENTQ